MAEPQSDIEKIGGIYRTISGTEKKTPAATKVLPDSLDPDTEAAAIPQSISQSRVEA